MFCQAILQFIFGNENVGIKLNSWNTKLFIIESSFQIFLNHSIPISNSKVMIKTLKPHEHIKSDERKKCRFHVWDSILRPIFDNENVGIRFNSLNTKLFIIELAFQIFSNHSILMSNSKVMIKTLKPHDHTKFEKRKNVDFVFGLAFWGPFLTMKTLE